MTQKEKLLLKDLCARLPYGVKYCRDSWNYEWDQEMSVVEVLEDIDKDGYINYHKVYKVDDIKPYLRPMSSMTEEEIKTYHTYCECNNGDFTGETLYFDTIESFDYLTSIHIDYRGLIPMGLALEAPDDMYGKI